MRKNDVLSKSKIKEFYYGERFGYVLYSRLAGEIKHETIRKDLIKMAEMERKHAEFWKKIAKKRDISLKDKKFRIKTFLYLLFSKISVLWIGRILESMEAKTIKEYYKVYKEGDLSPKEKKDLRKIIKDELLHEGVMHDLRTQGSMLEHTRDVFLGMNDGLVEILATIAGLVGLYSSKPIVIGITGMVVGVSGMLSMSIGTYISVKNQREMKERVYTEDKIVKEITGKEENIGSMKYTVLENPLKSAYITGIFYILGTLLVVYPFFLLSSSSHALLLSILTASLTWILAGSIVAITSGISIKAKIFEMLVTGLGAALLTYSLGSLINKIAGGLV